MNTKNMVDTVKSFREVGQIHTFSQKWKDITAPLGGSAGMLQEIKLPEKAGGYSYNESSKLSSNCRNRFIYWKTTNDTLELVELSLDFNMIGNCVRYNFQDASLVGGVSIHETHNKVVVLVCTLCSVHRLMFPHPDTLKRIISIFSDASVTAVCDISNYHHVTNTSGDIYQVHTSSSWLQGDGEAIFAMATNTCSIVLVKLPPYGIQGIKTQHELKQSSMMRGLLTGLVPPMLHDGAKATDIIASLCMYPLGKDIFIFGICKDHKLKMWSSKSEECVMACDLLEHAPGYKDQQQQPMGARGHVVKVCPGDYGSPPVLAVYLCLPDKAQFCVFKPVLSDGCYQLSHVSSIYSLQDDLVDFSVTRSHIWTVLDNGHGDNLVKYAAVESSDTKEESWNNVHLLNPESANLQVPFHKEPREFFMEYIFHPGRFSLETIMKAVNVYRRSHEQTNVLISKHMPLHILKDVVSETVENEIQMAAGDDMTEEDFCQLQLSQWTRLFSSCIQYHEVSRRMLGIFIDANTGMVTLIKKSQLSFLRSCDTTEHLYLSPSHMCALEDFSTEEGLCDDPRLCTDILTIMDSMKLLREHLSKALHLVEHNMFLMLMNPESIIQNVLITETSGKGLSSLSHELAPKLHNVQNIPKSIDAILEMMDLARGQAKGIVLEQNTAIKVWREYICSHLFKSRVGRTVLSDSIGQISATRFDVLRDLIILELFATREQTGLPLDVSGLITSYLLPKTSFLLQAYFVMKWISNEQPTTVLANTLEFNLRQLDALEITVNKPRSFEIMSNSFQPTNLIEMYLDGDGGTQVRAMLTECNFFENVACAIWHESLKPAIVIVLQLIWPISSNFLFPEFLMLQCQYMQLLEYIRLLQTWCGCNSSSRKFLQGQCFLNYSEPYKALDCFLEAVDGVQNEEFLANKLLLLEDNACSSKVKVLYYSKVIRLFEEFSLPDIIISLATTAVCIADQDNINTAALWSTIFKNHLEMGHNDEAYAAMIQNPDPVGRKASLRKFLVVLSEREEQHLFDELASIMESRVETAVGGFPVIYSEFEALHKQIVQACTTRLQERLQSVSTDQNTGTLQVETAVESFQEIYSEFEVLHKQVVAEHTGTLQKTVESPMNTYEACEARPENESIEEMRRDDISISPTYLDFSSEVTIGIIFYYCDSIAIVNITIVIAPR